MAVVMQMKWDGVSLDQYDAARKMVNMDGELPAGMQYHAAWHQDGVFHVCDVWDSAEAFQQYVEQRLMPGIHAVGTFQGEPQILVLPAHATLAGASSH